MISPIEMLKYSLCYELNHSSDNISVIVDRWFKENVLELGVGSIISHEALKRAQSEAPQLRKWYEEKAGHELGRGLIKNPELFSKETIDQYYGEHTNYRVLILKPGINK